MCEIILPHPENTVSRNVELNPQEHLGGNRVLRSGVGRYRPVVTVHEISSLATCYAGLTSRNRPKAAAPCRGNR